MNDEDIMLLADEIEANYAHLEGDEWHKIVSILAQRANV